MPAALRLPLDRAQRLHAAERRVIAQEGPADGTWEAFSCKDGLTGCVGFSGDNERALMLSYVVRAPPRLVVKVGPSSSKPRMQFAHALSLKTWVCGCYLVLSLSTGESLKAGPVAQAPQLCSRCRMSSAKSSRSAAP